MSKRRSRAARAERAAEAGRPGRPTKLDDAMIDAVSAAIRKGLTHELSCLEAGIVKETLYAWRAKGEEDRDAGIDSIHARFSDRIARAQAEHAAAALAVVDELMAESTPADAVRIKAATWLLQCRHGYGRDAKVQVTGEVTHTGRVDLSGLTTQQLREMAGEDDDGEDE